MNEVGQFATSSSPERGGDAALKATRKIDLIWNVTLVCGWDCAICCVDAVHVTKRAGLIKIRSQALTKLEELPFQQGQGSHFDQALAVRQKLGLELDIAGKLRVLDHLEGLQVKLDISGGDPLAPAENMLLLQAAARRFGKQSITLTATGAGMARYQVADIAPYISELNFTYDNLSPLGNESRPAGYADGNLRKASQFAHAGVSTRGECPLTVHNLSDENLRNLYLNLHEAGIDKLLIMRLFPVGRGVFRASDVPSAKQYRHAIELLREMEARYGNPIVKLQCALKFFDRPQMEENPCDLIHESFGMRPDGTLLASPWAVGAHGTPLHDEWVLGNLATTSMKDILASEKVRSLEDRLDENFGQCKIHAFLASRREAPRERIFDHADPLYASDQETAEYNLAPMPAGTGTILAGLPVR